MACDEVVDSGFVSYNRSVSAILQLHVAEIANRLFVQRPVVKSPVPSCRSAPEARLVTGVAAISHETCAREPPASIGIVPLKPPPPNFTARPFHVSGNATWKLIGLGRK